MIPKEDISHGARLKFYCLDFFPYPSGAGLTVGHCRNYVPTDVISPVSYTHLDVYKRQVVYQCFHYRFPQLGGRL